jgi:hypothetical protein
MDDGNARDDNQVLEHRNLSLCNLNLIRNRFIRVTEAYQVNPFSHPSSANTVANQLRAFFQRFIHSRCLSMDTW